MLHLTNKQLYFVTFVLAALVIGAYLPSLSVPFYLDDIDSIINNQALHSDSLELLMANGYLSRIVGYSTLWMNYQVVELDITVYHAVNLIIHLVNSLVLFFFARLLMRFFSADTENPQHTFWALVIAALWALHPLNSQPVIYIVQRLSSLSALFIFLTAFFYIKARVSGQPLISAGYFCLAMACGLAGAFTKQNFFIVLVFLFCWEWFNAKGSLRFYLNRLTLTGFVLLVFIAPFPFMEAFWQNLDALTRDPGATDRVSYFYTQTIVLWDYIFRFFVPYPLQLDIDVTLRHSLEPIVALALLAHAVLLTIAIKMRNSVPLFFWGILFFYLSHLVESFIFPIKDLAFEHRTYVGNFGLILAVVALIRYKTDGYMQHSKRMFIVFFTGMAVLCLTGSALIHKRSIQWQDPLTFYERELQYSPEHIRTNASYGTELAKAGRLEEAEKYLKKSIDLNLAQSTISFGVLNAYMNVLYQQQKFQQAAPVVMIALKHVHYPERRSILLSNLAVGYIYMGYCDFALGLLEQALKLFPANQDAMNNRNYCLQQGSGG